MFETVSVYIRKSAGDLWVTSPGARSIDMGQPLNANIEAFIRMNPRVTRVEVFSWGAGTWRTPGQPGDFPVYLTGIDASDDGLVLAKAVPLATRRLLREPGTVAIDISEREKLGVDLGGFAEISGHRVRVVGFMEGMRALGGINVVAALPTARRIDPAMRESDRVAFFVARVDHPDMVDEVREALSPRGPNPRYEAMTAEEFADRTTNYWLFESGMGTAFLLSSVIALLVSVVITSQTLMAAVAASIREYATLRALGIPAGALRGVVMRQSAYVGVSGLLASGLVCAAVLWTAKVFHVSAALTLPIALGCGALVMIVALTSGLTALLQLNKADPASLLR
jgi:putative ABC transport system permease protein